MISSISLVTLTLLPVFVLSVPYELPARPFDLREVGPPIDIPPSATDVPPSANVPTISGFDNQCTQRSIDDQVLIEQELLVAQAIARIGATIQPASLFYQALFSQDLRDAVGFQIQVNTKYTNLASIYTSGTNNVKITCDSTPTTCPPNTFASTFAAGNRINLCPAWFDDTRKNRSSTVASECMPSNTNANNWKNLDKYKATKSFTLLHEMAHLRYATGTLTQRPRAADYAYGVPNCKTLAAGAISSQKCNLANPGGNPVLCPASFSFQNADTLAFVPAGEYWQARCGRVITVDNLDGSADPIDFDGEDIDNP